VQIAIKEYFKKQNKSKKINLNYFLFCFKDRKNEKNLVRNGATSKHAHRHNQKQGRDRR
jgi:hypothetical protein